MIFLVLRDCDLYFQKHVSDNRGTLASDLYMKTLIRKVPYSRDTEFSFRIGKIRC